MPSLWAVCVTTAEGGGEGGEGTDEGEEGASGGGGGSGDAGPCREPGEVLGGHWACSELAWGRMCRASCLPGFVMTADPPSPLYICGRHTGQWYPSAHLPTCTRKFLSSRSCSLTCPPAFLREYFPSLHSTEFFVLLTHHRVPSLSLLTWLMRSPFPCPSLTISFPCLALPPVCLIHFIFTFPSLTFSFSFLRV